jgi:hypothetical protein
VTRWAARIEENGGGSLITAVAEKARMPLIAWLLGIPFFFGYAVLRNGLGFALVFLPICLTVMPVLGPCYWAWVANREAPFCRAILLRATQATTAS